MKNDGHLSISHQKANEQDTNDDGLLDVLNLKVELPLDVDEQVQQVQAMLFFDLQFVVRMGELIFPFRCKL